MEKNEVGMALKAVDDDVERIDNIVRRMRKGGKVPSCTLTHTTTA